jgi:polar amino acid transport system permease protein/polar amino acid transport system substrate-binding protein
VYFYDVREENLQMYLSDEALDHLLGGYVSVKDDISATTEITVGGETVSIASDNTFRNGINQCFGLKNYDAEKPDTSSPLQQWLNGIKLDFHKNFIEENRWLYLVEGVGNTLALTGLSLLLGIVLGLLTAIVRVVHEKTDKLYYPDKIAKLYVSLIRGTPLMVQLLIIYFVLLLPIGIERFPAAVLCFGLNSGAYVSEIIRGGIMSVDPGQTEAGRSLGFGFGATMFHIVMPQAFKAVLPALCNEFISLLKETSVAFYIGVADLTRGGIKIRSITYSNFMPLVAVALIYLALVLILTKLVGILERRLRKSER